MIAPASCSSFLRTRAPAKKPDNWTMVPHRLTFSVWLAAMLLAGARPAISQKISVNVNLVTVSFTARGPHGALVDNLTRDDIELFEDNAPQKIAFFAKSSDVPLTLGLIVDASNSQEHFRKRHEKDLELFLRNVLGPKDRAFLL